MISVLRHRNTLYYAVHNQDHDITTLDEASCVWFWLDAPENIRRIYRNRPDFWAVAPSCISRQYMNTYVLRNR